MRHHLTVTFLVSVTWMLCSTDSGWAQVADDNPEPPALYDSPPSINEPQRGPRREPGREPRREPGREPSRKPRSGRSRIDFKVLDSPDNSGPEKGGRHGIPLRGPRGPAFRGHDGQRPGMGDFGPPSPEAVHGMPHPGERFIPGGRGAPRVLRRGGLFGDDSLRENDPEMYKLQRSDLDLERRSNELAMRVKQAPSDQREKLKEELERLIDEHFDIRKQRRELQLTRLEEQLKELRRSLEERDNLRQQIVQKRMTELTGDVNSLDF